MSDALCKCGCGQPAPLAKQTITTKGIKKGEPFEYCYNHRPKPRKTITTTITGGSLCECGCGERVPILRRLLTRPIPRFIRGHQLRQPLITSPYRGTTTSDGRSVREHVVIAERALGRLLPSGAEVHHVNGNGLDNRNRNLVICQDSAYHTLLHVHQRVLAAGGNPFTERICCKCHQLKPLTEFYVRQGRKLLGGECKPCARAYTRAYLHQKQEARDAAL